MNEKECKTEECVKELKKENQALRKEIEIVQGKVEKYEDDYQSQPIEFISESSSDSFSLIISEVAFIKSADNYVEIVYREDEQFKSKLIRNTMKNIELQLKSNSSFVRCHRTCIVNANYIEKLSKDLNNHWLSIKGYEEHIPVSRQYLLKIREAI